uniref:Craniofacial development protein 1 n=1 Tax=Amblyomma americanum TaxID=6943 RepID=A0A0C9R250_AMBAM
MSTLDLAKPADSSESEDDDYVPSAEESEDASEAENCVGSDDEESAVKKRKKSKKKPVSRKRKGGIHLDGEDDPVCNSAGSGAEDGEKETPAALTEEEEKKRADQLWSDFLKDVEPIPKKRSAPVTNTVTAPSISSPSVTCPQAAAPAEKKVKVTQLLEFAGETIKVEKEVAADSKEAHLFAKGQEDVAGQSKSPMLSGKRKPGGVGNVLNQLFNKKQKISTLEKSKLDWDSYKQSEGIAEDLQNHNRGKDGYLEKQAFLQRTDLRQFEIEKTLRAKSRSTNYL